MSARVVVVGGGITGCSVAYHLARAGWRDVVVLEKGELTSGSTHHAAGLVTQFNPSATMMRFRRYSVSLYNELGVFNTVGSVRIASSADSLRDLQRAVSRARALGLDAELLGPGEVLERLPFASRESLYGGVWMAEDGHVDPHITTYAVADAARALGAEIRIAHARDRHRARPRPRGAGGAHDAGRIETEHVVDAAGVWAPQVAEMVGARLPSVPVDHQHILMQAVPGAEVPRGSPCFRDTDNLVYGKDEAGGMLIGGYEQNPVARWTDGVPWDHGASPVESDMDRFVPLLEGAIRRFPFLDRAGVIRLLCHPGRDDTRRQPAARSDAGDPGFWVAAGLSLNGFGGAGGIGRALAEWIIDGEPELDVSAYRAWRFGPAYHDPWFATRLRPRGVSLLLPPALPVRRRRVGPRAALEPAAGSPPGARRRVRNQERLGACRSLRARQPLAPQRRRSATVRLDAAAVVRARRRGARGVPRTGRDHRHDVVRQDRGERAGRAGAARARVRQPDRPAGRQCHLHAVPQRAAAGSSPT